MLEVQGKIEWVSTLEVDTNKPGIVPGVITPTFYGSLEEIVEALPSMIDRDTLNPFRKISSVWIRTGGTEGYSVFEYIARVCEHNCTYPEQPNKTVLMSVLIGEFGSSYVERGQEVIQLTISPLSQREIKTGINNTTKQIDILHRTIYRYQLDLEEEELEDKKDVIRSTIKQYENNIQSLQEELDFFKKHLISE